LLRPFVSLRLYGHVVAAGLPAMALISGAWFGLRLAGTEAWLGSVFGEGLWATWLASLPSAAAWSLVVLPIVFADLDAVTTFSPFWRSLARSLRFAALAPGLLLAFGLFRTVLSSAMDFAPACARAAGPPGESFWSASMLIVAAATALVILALRFVLHAVFYREFVWREREGKAAGRGHGS
jgi:hypothetical protein